MAARARGSGSIVALDRKKDGTKLPNSKCTHWRLKVSTGVVGHRDDGSRKYGQVTRRFTGTYRQAEDELAKLRDEVNAGRLVRRSPWLLGEWLDHFHNVRKSTGAIKESTAAANECEIKRLKQAFGGIKLSDVDSSAVDSAVAAMMSGDATGRKVSANTIKHCTMPYLMAALKKAAKDGLFDMGRVEDVGKVKATATAKRSMTEEEVIGLSKELSPRSGRDAIVHTVLWCGLRLSEALGLKWSDVRHDGLHVVKQQGLEGERSSTKTESGVRIVPIPEHARAFLEEWRGCQKAAFDGVVEWSEDVRIVSVDGSVPTQRALGAWWEKRRKRLGYDYSFHELRHTYATMLAASGIGPAVIRDLMGHEKADLAIEVYTHVNTTHRANAVDSMTEYVKGFSKG